MTSDPSAHGVEKSATGVAGLDDITGGGLPRGRTTLIEGGPGAGKTVLALQSLVNAARHGEPGIFVTFEQAPKRMLADLASFGWQIESLMPDRLFLLDAQPSPELITSGAFDLNGLIAILDAKASAMGAKRIVFDALDALLALLQPDAARREVHRLHAWLLAREYTAIVTHKAQEPSDALASLGFMHFMVDCTLRLKHDVVDGTSQRSIRVLKYRGSSFEEDELPLLIGEGGVEVAWARTLDDSELPATFERVSSGMPQLDDLLQGGYFRGAGILITGAPGTAKTTLAGAFALAACRRGERVLYVSFDSSPGEIIRNLSSVDIQLAEFVRNDTLQIVGARAINASSEVHLMRIRQLAKTHRPSHLIIDPISALSKSGNATIAHSVIERLIQWTKGEALTLLCTSLLDGAKPGHEGTPLQISTVADTWIHLNYIVLAGERNRTLSIVKSRGTAHSNQVRELILTAAGLSLSDVYTAGGEVLMGTARWEKELAELRDQAEGAAEMVQRARRLEMEATELEERERIVRHELTLKREEQAALTAQYTVNETNRIKAGAELRRRRSTALEEIG